MNKTRLKSSSENWGVILKHGGGKESSYFELEQ